MHQQPEAPSSSRFFSILLTVRAGPMLRLLRSTPAAFARSEGACVTIQRLVADPEGPRTQRQAGIHAGAELSVRVTERTQLLIGAVSVQQFEWGPARDRDQLIFGGVGVTLR
jgi:hypothetical protein